MSNTANSFVTPGPAIAITAATAALAFAPPPGAGQGGYSDAIVVNSSPWLATLLCATGAVSIQPYTADTVQVGGNQQLIVSMSVPPGGSATPPAGSLTFIQVDWYTAGGAPPDGVYPLALTSQAITAAVIGAIESTSPQTLLATVPGGTDLVTVTLPANCQSLMVLSSSALLAQAIGITSGYEYPRMMVGGIISANVVEVITSQAIDAQIQIFFPIAPTGTWYVLANAATQIVASMGASEGVPGFGFAPPYYATYAAGTDGAALRPFSTDTNGRLIPLVPTAVASRLTSGVILAAPTSGGNYLFGFNTTGNVAGGSVVLLTDGGTLDVAVGFDSLGANTGSVMCPLFSYRTTTAVTMGVFGNALSQGNLLYAPGP